MGKGNGLEKIGAREPSNITINIPLPHVQYRQQMEVDHSVNPGFPRNQKTCRAAANYYKELR